MLIMGRFISVDTSTVMRKWNTGTHRLQQRTYSTTPTLTVGNLNKWMVVVRVVMVVAVDPGIIIELLTGDNFSPV